MEEEIRSEEPSAQTAAKKLTRKEKKELRKQKVRERRAARAVKVRMFPANKNGYHIMHFMNFLRFLFYWMHFLIFPYKLHGPHKVGKGAYIYFGNHYHIFDVFYPALSTKEGVHFITKQSVLEAPVIGYWAYLVGAIGANRDGSDVHTVISSMKVLRNGEKLSMFPEGMRNRSGGDEFLPFHGGTALLAIKTKTPIVPFVICNRPKVFRVTHVVFGEPFELSQYYGRKLTPEDYAEAEELLRNKLYEMRAQFRASRAKK